MLLGSAVLALLLLCMLPAGWLTWVGWFGGLAEKAVVPVQTPVHRAASWFGGRFTDVESSPEVAALREEADRSRTLYLQTLEELSAVREQVESLQSGRAIPGGGVGVMQVLAPVLGMQGDGFSRVLKVRAGRAQGVLTGDAVAYRGVHLVGRVIGDPDAQFSRVQIVTDKAAGGTAGGSGTTERGRINGVVILGESDARLPTDPLAERLVCLLAPTGDGRLSGDVAVPSRAASSSHGAGRVPVGAIVRLLDERWPASAQMLVLGRVIREEAKANQRQTIVVEPFFDAGSIREVIVRVSGDPAAAGSGGAP